MNEELIERLRMTEQMLNAAHFKEAESLIREARDAIEELQSKLTASRRLKKGKWIKKMRIIETDKYASYNPEWYCSCCGGGYEPYIAELISFCPNCGADMRGEKTDDK